MEWCDLGGGGGGKIGKKGWFPGMVLGKFGGPLPIQKGGVLRII